MTTSEQPPPRRDDPPQETDQPEPDEALAGSGAETPDHEPSDLDDRDVPLDDPEVPELPLDEDDVASAAPDPEEPI